jgi:drug/metabolite transporter (DMT)-like permease
MFVATQWLIKPLYFEAYVAYVSTLYRLQILFTVVLGYLIFKEQDIKKRLVAATIIIVGAMLIASDDLPARITSHLELFGF